MLIGQFWRVIPRGRDAGAHPPDFRHKLPAF